MKHLLLAFSLIAFLTACGGGGVGPATEGAGDNPDNNEPNTVLVKMTNEEHFQELLEETGSEVVRRVGDTDYYVVEVPDGVTEADFQEQLEGDDRVEDYEDDIELSAPEGGGSSIPLGGEFFSIDVGRQPALLRIGLLQAHARTTGSGVTVAMIDTGVIGTHPLLAGKILGGGWDFIGDDADPTDEPNGRDDDEDGFVDEGYGHGTFVASLILAVAPDARIRPYRVLNSDSIGTASALAEAITMATNSGADVINLSAGMPTRVQVVKDATNYALDLGVMVISSAGNTGNDDVTFPAALSDSFSVTAVDTNDVQATFASFGGDVDISAPGVNLLGAFPNANGAASWSGTSFSAAVVTGAFALVKAGFPEIEGNGVLERLRFTARSLVPSNGERAERLGEGLLDLDRATDPEFEGGFDD